MTKDLTVGSPMRLILGFALPTLLGMVFQQFYNLVDAMIVGKLLGASALGAVGSTGSINFLVIGFCMGLCNGFVIPVAQRMGAGDYSRMRRYVANAAYLSAAFALVMTVATCLLCKRILTVTLTPEDIFTDAFVYIFIIFLGIPTTFLYNLLAGVIRSLGDSKTPVYFLALSSFLNILLDFILILRFDAGVAGAAIATVAAQGVSGLACLGYMVKKYPILRMSREERRLDGRACLTLCGQGIPMGLQYSITATGSIILQASVNTLGSLYVAGVTAGTKVYQLICCPFDAMGATMATYCGQNVGAVKLDRLGKGIKACSILGLGYSLLSLAVMLVLAPQFVMLFLSSKEAELALLVELSTQYILVGATFFFPLALVNIVRFSIQGMGYSVFAILAGVLEMAARTGVGVLLVPVLGYTAVCFASPAAWVAADLFLIPASLWCIKRLRRLHPAQAREEEGASHQPVPLKAGAGQG